MEKTVGVVQNINVVIIYRCYWLSHVKPMIDDILSCFGVDSTLIHGVLWVKVAPKWDGEIRMSKSCCVGLEFKPSSVVGCIPRSVHQLP